MNGVHQIGQPQPRPQIGHGAQMVLVGVGQDQAVEKGPLLLDEAQVGQDDVDAGQPVVGEAEAQIDHQPAAVLAVEIGS